MLGTALRVGVSGVVPDAGAVPIGTLTVNLVGAFLIGIVAVRLPAGGDLRLLLGTGLLGGFTTYSAFALGIQQLGLQAPVLAAAYALLSIVTGVLAAALGHRLARPRSRP